MARRDAIARGWSRRRFLGAALTAGAATLAPRPARAKDPPRTSIRFRPFTEDLPIPIDMVPGERFLPRCFYRPEWLDIGTYYHVTMRRGVARILPGVETEIWGYDGLYPGPTLRANAREEVFVRFTNDLPAEQVIHLHSGHPPADSDGFPDDYIRPGESRDYAYPMQPAGGEVAEGFSTIWYHDHTMDETAANVYRGLAGFAIVTDDLEDALVDSGRLPAPPYDVPLVLQDRRFNRDGSLYYDFFDHDGFLGDVFCVNGKAQPRLAVERRRYRFRILNGANARHYLLRLSTGRPFLQVGSDAWLFPQAQLARSILLAPAERADLVVDFRDAPGTVYLEDLLGQDDGRGLDGDRERPRLRRTTPLLRFDVRPGTVLGEGSLEPGDPLRPHDAIDPREVERTRVFEFGRRRGAWVVNDEFFDPDRSDARPRLGGTERWIFRNEGGGWWHPIHVHDEAFQVQRVNGRRPAPHERFKKDTLALGPNDEAEVLMRFRDWPGRYVFHCHNLEHEDMRMMGRFDVG